MALDYFPCYHSYRKKTAKLSDQEVGRLFRALLEYSELGETKELTGRESVAFDFIVYDIDRAKDAYEEKCETNRKNGQKGANATERPPTPANAPQNKSESKSKGKNENNLSPDGESIGAVRLPAFETEELQSAFADWLTYKAEQRKPYKPKGLQALESEVCDNAAKYGEAAVARLIRQCMASGWQGIIFDRLEQSSGQQRNRGNTTPAYSRDAVDPHAREDFERMKRMLEEMKREESESCT